MRTARMFVLSMLTIAVLGTPGRAWAQESAVADAIVGDTLDQLWTQCDRHWHKGEYRHIITLCRVIVEGQPTFVRAYQDAGWLLWGLDEEEEALALYDRGISANPETYALYWEKGYVLSMRMRDWTAALPVLRKAADCKDCPPMVLHSLAHAYERTGDLRASLATWERAASNPKNPIQAAARVNRDRVKAKLDQQRREPR